MVGGIDNKLEGTDVPKDDGGSKPVPDPTLLTTQQLQREIRQILEFIEAKMRGNREVLEFKCETLARDIEKLRLDARYQQEQLERKIQESVTASIIQLKETRDEKFKTIQVQYEDTKTSIATALVSQREITTAQNAFTASAFAKSEITFTKLIDQTQTILNTVTKSMDDKINDLKSRLDKGEGQDKGSASMWGYVVGVIGLMIAIATVAVLAAGMHK